MNRIKRDPMAVAEAIASARRIAVCSHVNPDGDTLGSAAAMRLALEACGHEVTLFCADKVPDNLAFLPGMDGMRRRPEPGERFDLLLAVDISDPARMGECAELRNCCRHTAQIDHHPTNPLYCEVNSVDGTAPSTCNMIREQIRVMNVPMSRDIAICLYTGMSTDTGNFAFSATNAECFEIMAELMRNGLPLSELSRILFREKGREQMRLLGRALNSLTFAGDGSIAVMKLTNRDFKECGALSEHADTIVNYGLETTGTHMAVLARETETPGCIKFSLRAKFPERIDDIAQQLGGGGHPQASGINLDGTLEDTLARVVKAMEKKRKGS